MEILETRIRNLEALTASQQVALGKLRNENDELLVTLKKLSELIDVLKDAGLGNIRGSMKRPGGSRDNDENDDDNDEDYYLVDDVDSDTSPMLYEYEYFDDEEIFGSAPSSVIEAADSAGAAILAAMLAGQRRMLVDVRDAELTNNPEILAQFVELAVLPVAAGLEGLNAERNRVKIVFPTVSQLLEYRKLSALAAPDVVALGTLNFGSLEDPDALVVVLAPSPDTEEFDMMIDILNPSDPSLQISQPIVVLNHHMNGFTNLPDPICNWEIVYHLRLLSVQYLAMKDDDITDLEEDAQDPALEAMDDTQEIAPPAISEEEKVNPVTDLVDDVLLDDVAFQSAAQEQARLNATTTPGQTRAMVIRAYPRPWHVFVDISDDEDADFEVAQTFVSQPTQDEVNDAIIECLEGSEMQDELVAKEMKEALESGQLDGVAARLLKSQKLDDLDLDEDGDEFPVPIGVEFPGSKERQAKELFMSNDNDKDEEDEEGEEEGDDEEIDG
eukprot:CAMPEP_0118646730 /NCGR_PEP_ID=MMETSP0785-20121206/8222_1 /TAXON_ID=91992 /ORGANISM="Bolidomonas pacifica, Strain CCMP 1866" /LENGTH=499 /DNA_ID=CAMNT_0006538763 /DNA_START=349 /DNA_END=1845 /DNA_ORIENTATION=-